MLFDTRHLSGGAHILTSNVHTHPLQGWGESVQKQIPSQWGRGGAQEPAFLTSSQQVWLVVGLFGNKGLSP